MLLAVACQAQGTWPYLTYFGGSGSENISAVSSDGNGGTFIAGTTSSVGPPFSTANEGYRSASSVFLTRIDASGQPVFTKLLGDGSLSALAVDADGNALLTGTIRVAPDFTTPGSFQPEASSAQAFVAKFTPSGDKLFATYFGSQNGVRIYTLTLDAEGRPIFCGSASGGSAPLTPSSLFQFEGRNAAPFCAQLTADGSGLVLSTLLSKPSANQISITTPLSADLDAEGRLIVGGSTSDSEFGVALDPQFEDRRRTLFRSRKGDRFEGIGGSRLGHVVSVQRIGKEVFVGTASNGAWVSPDGGDTWRQIPGALPALWWRIHSPPGFSASILSSKPSVARMAGVVGSFSPPSPVRSGWCRIRAAKGHSLSPAASPRSGLDTSGSAHQRRGRTWTPSRNG